MNRRQFNASLGALAAAPLMPALPASAATAPTALSATAARMYPWAAQYARVHGQASAATLASAFKIPPHIAAEVSAQLVAKGVATPAAGATLRAVQPVDWSTLQRVQSSAPAQHAPQLKDSLRKLSEAQEPAPTEATGAELEPTPEDQSSGSEECQRA